MSPQQSGALFGSAAADQWSDSGFGYALLYGNPGDQFKAWDTSATFDYMPSQYITFRWEFDHRAANVPYFSGPGGVTPTSCPNAPLVENICGTPGAFVPGFTPDLKKIENRINLSILVKF